MNRLQLKKEIVPDWKSANIDLDVMVERLQDLEVYDCHLMAASDVKTALNKWLNHFLDTIPEDIEWFIKRFSESKFKASLPEPSIIEEFDACTDDDLVA